jgi:uncharacterized protein YdaU (DUF1376 family)
MSRNPPAFQFYAKDWTSSHTVANMTMHHRGIYITLLAAAWESDPPGTLPLPLEATARSARLDIRSLRDFMAKFPRCFVEIGSKLVNEKLHQNWLNYQEISDKRRKAAETRYTANAKQMDHSFPSPASAPNPQPIIIYTPKEPRVRKVFEKPTLEQLAVYMAEIGKQNPNFQSQSFLNHYDSNGWMVGRNHMKDWQAAARNWKDDNLLFGGNGKGVRKSSEEAVTAYWDDRRKEIR